MKRQTPTLSVRKRPQQERSSQLVDDILAGAIRVLARHGATKFTTARVAEETGVSVGSLYQYFPNKEAILFRLQSEEWTQTSAMLTLILADTQVPFEDRIHTLTRAFFRSEREERELRQALADAAPLYRDTPEARRRREESTRVARAFIDEVLPTTEANARAFVTDIFLTTLGALGKKMSMQARNVADVDARADAVADMLCAYLATHRNPRARNVRKGRAM